MPKLKIGILGASRGMDFAERMLLDYEYAEVTAVCETYPVLFEKCREFFREHHKDVYCCDSFDDMLDAGIDAVIIANYANEHAAYVIKALERGVHVYSEVQPVQTLAEACQLCDAVEKSGKVYAYGENYCYFDHNFAMRQQYDSGIIGEAVSLEGTFCNDCSPKWHLLTRGVRDHWRNYVPSSFYCSHSIGPLFFTTGLRSVRVNGAETPRMPYMAAKGSRTGSGAMLLMELNNAGIARSSISNGLKHPYIAAYRIIGEKGSIESADGKITVFRYDKGFQYDIHTDTPSYSPFLYRPDKDQGCISNSDLTGFAYFIAKILGDPIGSRYSIDVYQALDMALPGLLGYRSIISKGMPYEIPDLRDPIVRDQYRNDHYCTDPRVASEYLLPTSKSGNFDVDESVYEAVREELSKVNLTPGMK